MTYDMSFIHNPNLNFVSSEIPDSSNKSIVLDYSKDNLFDKAGLKRLHDSYMLSSEISPQERFASVSEKFSSNPEHAQRLYDYSSKHWLSYSTPILSFGRTKKGLPISCYLVYQSDTSEGLVATMSETAWLSMLGGGVGIHLGIRAADEKSTGVMPHLKVFDAETLAYRQSTVRRGSYAVFLDIDHPDIKMFIDLRKATGDPNMRCQNLHHGVNISDKFMNLIEKCMSDPSTDDSWELIDPHSKKIIETVSAKNLWETILIQRIEKGEPYIVFIDRANEALPHWLKNKGLRINGSNLCCLTGDTEVLTKEFGISKIEDLVEQNVTIFDGNSWITNNKFELKGTTNKIYRVHIFDGSYIDCTDNHRWFIASNYEDIRNKKYTEVLTKNLKVGQWLESHNQEYHGAIQANAAYIKGFLLADGTSSKKSTLLRLHFTKYCCEEKLISSALEAKIEEVNTTCITDVSFGKERKYSQAPGVFGRQEFKEMKGLTCRKSLHFWSDIYKVNFPDEVFSWNKKSKLEFLAGLFDGDGSGGRHLQISSIHEEFILKLQKLIKTFGYNCNVDIIPRDVKKVSYRLTISSYDAYNFIQQLPVQRLKWEGAAPDRKTTQWRSITEIEQLIGDFTVYCTTVKTTGKFALANGLMSGNSEILLPTSEDRTAVCCLSSLNLEYFDDWKDNDVFISDVVEMLDNVLIYFSENAPDTLTRAKNSAINERDIGLGAIGFHAYLQKKNVPFESVVASSINREVFKYIKAKVDTVNSKLALIRGEAPDAKGQSVRFSHTMAVAPNASSATIMGNTSPSIEPYRANIFRQDTLSGALIVKNRFLDKQILEICDKDSTLSYNKIWSSIIANNGSIQHLDVFNDWTKDVFKTAMEINQFWIIQHASDRQPYIDQSQSLNLFFSPDTDIKYIHDVHFNAWKKGLKTLYYLRSDKTSRAEVIGSQIKKTEYLECLSCEG